MSQRSLRSARQKCDGRLLAALADMYAVPLVGPGGSTTSFTRYADEVTEHRDAAAYGDNNGGTDRLSGIGL